VIRRKEIERRRNDGRDINQGDKFSGRKQDCITWHITHLAREARKGYREVLDGTVKIQTISEKASLDPTNDADKIKLVAKNKEAYSDLILSMMDGTPHGNVAFDIVRQAVSADYPNGDAGDAMARLKKKSINQKQLPNWQGYTRFFMGQGRNDVKILICISVI
jgi:hypothetical protein